MKLPVLDQAQNCQSKNSAFHFIPCTRNLECCLALQDAIDELLTKVRPLNGDLRKVREYKEKIWMDVGKTFLIQPLESRVIGTEKLEIQNPSPVIVSRVTIPKTRVAKNKERGSERLPYRAKKEDQLN